MLTSREIRLMIGTAVITLSVASAPYLTGTPVLAKGKGKRHPMLQECLTKLQSTQKVLQTALTKYGKSDPVGGHRAKALDDVNDAIKELQAGIAMP